MLWCRVQPHQLPELAKLWERPVVKAVSEISLLLNTGNSFKHIKKKIQAKQNSSAGWVSSWRNQIKNIGRTSAGRMGLLSLGAGWCGQGVKGYLPQQRKWKHDPTGIYPSISSTTCILIFTVENSEQIQDTGIQIDNRKFM